jgi:phage terminase large subunit-like protein
MNQQAPIPIRKPVSQLTRGEKVIEFIEAFCRVPEGALVGQKIKLADFQKQFILDVYDNPHGTHTAILSKARKNAKTATIACIGLAHIAGPEAQQNSQIVSGALSRDQAAIVFKLMSKMIKLDPRLDQVCKITPSGKTIIGLRKNVEYRALSADASTAHGLSPILAILDEVGQVKGPTSPFIEAITSSQGAHDNPLLIMISTQAASDADFLSMTIDDAIRSGDPGIVVHLYQADKNCELMDEDQWKKANPALDLFRSRSDLKKQLEKASRIPSLEASARNLLLNQRISLESLWMAPAVWRANSTQPDVGVFREHPVSLGLDLSAKTDLTAAVFACKDDKGNVHVIPFVFTPLRGVEERAQRDRAPYQEWIEAGALYTAGVSTVDYAAMVEMLMEFQQRNNFEITSIEYDRWRIEVLQRDSKELGFGVGSKWNPVGQGYKDFSPRVERFEELMLQELIRHGNHPLLQMAAANAIAVKSPAGDVKLDKSKSTQRIDPLVAAVMAVYGVSAGNNKSFDISAMIG